MAKSFRFLTISASVMIIQTSPNVKTTKNGDKIEEIREGVSCY